MKKKIAFALLMGIITTGIISFTLLSVNIGFSPEFGGIWLRSWVLAYCIATPAILVLGPVVQQVVEKLFAVKEPLEKETL